MLSSTGWPWRTVVGLSRPWPSSAVSSYSHSRFLERTAEMNEVTHGSGSPPNCRSSEPTGNTEVEQAMLQVPKAFGELMATVMHELKVPKAVEEL